MQETEKLTLMSLAWMPENHVRKVGKNKGIRKIAFGVEDKWPIEFAHLQLMLSEDPGLLKEWEL